VGGVGLIADYARRAEFASLKAGDVLVLVGETDGELGASMYLREILGREDGAPPPVDLALEKKTGDFVRGLIRDGVTACVHDLSDGGLVAAAAEMALASGVGLSVTAPRDGPDHAVFFGEDQGRYLLAVPRARLGDLEARAGKAGVEYLTLGEAGGEALSLAGASGPLATIPLAELRTAHEGWMPGFMGE
jgi:phosphoribosylformylglycinamidine synthase